MKLKYLKIENFKGIESQEVNDIQSALILIGKNNSGKSAFLTAVRTLWGDYSPTPNDFYKLRNTFTMEARFEITDDYLDSLFYNQKIGFFKYPSSAGEYNVARVGTQWEEVSYNMFKEQRTETQQTNNLDPLSLDGHYKAIWISAINNKFHIENGVISVKLICDSEDCKLKYEINETECKEFPNILPQLAFIDDTRYFEEEESGKAKSLTASIFNIILSNNVTNHDTIDCKDCNNLNCDDYCINDIRNKSIDELSINDLEKLITYKTNMSFDSIRNRLSTKFSQNYRQDFGINLKATSNVDKSFAILTKIYDPVLDSELNLSNVGAGLRSIYILCLLQTYQELLGQNTIFIIEEPELYLHPELQKSMAKTLWEISNNSQVIFTTHSAIMLNEFKSNEVRKVSMDLTDYKTIISITQLDDILQEIGYSSQDILNTDFVIFVEGQDDLKCLNEIISKYYDINMSRITIIDTKSCQNIETYATLRFLHKTTLNTNFAIFRDSDTMDSSILKTKITNQMRENIHADFLETVESRIYITEPSSIEGFFIDLDILLRHRVYNSVESLESNLKHKLQNYKEKHMRYFLEKNSNNEERISTFNAEYDDKIINPIDNIDWLKRNIRGHDLFGYLNAGRISFETYVNELPSTAFEHIFNFLDTIDYFEERKRI